MPAEGTVSPYCIRPRSTPTRPQTLGRSSLWDPDRKSTRLNSSHSQISYAVFCLKKKKNSPKLNRDICHVRGVPNTRRRVTRIILHLYSPSGTSMHGSVSPSYKHHDHMR